MSDTLLVSAGLDRPESGDNIVLPFTLDTPVTTILRPSPACLARR